MAQTGDNHEGEVLRFVSDNTTLLIDRDRSKKLRGSLCNGVVLYWVWLGISSLDPRAVFA